MLFQEPQHTIWYGSRKVNFLQNNSLKVCLSLLVHGVQMLQWFSLYCLWLLSLFFFIIIIIFRIIVSMIINISIIINDFLLKTQDFLIYDHHPMLNSITIVEEGLIFLQSFSVGVWTGGGLHSTHIPGWALRQWKASYLRKGSVPWAVNDFLYEWKLWVELRVFSSKLFLLNNHFEPFLYLIK